jgi:protein involved in polysaccharide export with SLBB domain
MKTGDVLIIPSKKQTVKVSGMVLRPSLVQFKKGMKLKSYIEKSGGFAGNAKKSKTFVTYPNGDVKTVSNFLFFRSYPKLAPGATIIVPVKPERTRKSLSTTEIVGITTSLATLGILIQTLVK